MEQPYFIIIRKLAIESDNTSIKVSSDLLNLESLLLYQHPNAIISDLVKSYNKEKQYNHIKYGTTCGILSGVTIKCLRSFMNLGTIINEFQRSPFKISFNGLNMLKALPLVSGGLLGGFIFGLWAIRRMHTWFHITQQY